MTDGPRGRLRRTSGPIRGRSRRSASVLASSSSPTYSGEHGAFARSTPTSASLHGPLYRVVVTRTDRCWTVFAPEPLRVDGRNLPRALRPVGEAPERPGDVPERALAEVPRQLLATRPRVPPPVRRRTPLSALERDPPDRRRTRRVARSASQAGGGRACPPPHAPVRRGTSDSVGSAVERRLVRAGSGDRCRFWTGCGDLRPWATRVVGRPSGAAGP